MWIRSQDKRILVNANLIYLNNLFDDKVISANNEINKVDLGNYKSKERALEVLDDLQSKIIIGNIVYQMPEE